MGIDTDKYEILYRPGSLNIYTLIEKSTGLSIYGAETREEVLENNPDLIPVTFEDFIESIRVSVVTEPKEITYEQFHEALNCMYPENWYSSKDFECFHMAEYLTSHYTATYARVGERHFCWTDTVFATVDDIKAKLLNAFPELMEVENA